MAITGTKAFTSGEILTANDVNQYLMRGVKVFGGTATRDASYGGAGEPVLEEGEACYLTDTDKLQVYGGTAAGWVDIGPAAAAVIKAVESATVNTSQGTSSTSYTDLATAGPSVTITTGTTALVTVCATFNHTGVDTGGHVSYAVSGATTVAAADDNGIRGIGTSVERFGIMSSARTLLVTGLTAGSNTFTLKYRSTGGGTMTFLTRSITVMAL